MLAGPHHGHVFQGVAVVVASSPMGGLGVAHAGHAVVYDSLVTLFPAEVSGCLVCAPSQDLAHAPAVHDPVHEGLDGLNVPPLDLDVLVHDREINGLVRLAHDLDPVPAGELEIRSALAAAKGCAVEAVGALGHDGCSRIGGYPCHRPYQELEHVFRAHGIGIRIRKALAQQVIHPHGPTAEILPVDLFRGLQSAHRSRGEVYPGDLAGISVCVRH